MKYNMTYCRFITPEESKDKQSSGMLYFLEPTRPHKEYPNMRGYFAFGITHTKTDWGYGRVIVVNDTDDDKDLYGQEYATDQSYKEDIKKILGVSKLTVDEFKGPFFEDLDIVIKMFAADEEDAKMQMNNFIEDVVMDPMIVIDGSEIKKTIDAYNKSH